MPTIRLTKEFSFEMAHSLWGYDGACRNIHGHSYRLQVTIVGSPNQEPGNPKRGMVMDFGQIKQLVNRAVVHRLDHAYMVGSDAPLGVLQTLGELFERRYVVDYQPTCENMIVDFAERIREVLPPAVSLYSLRLYETATSYAEWYAHENP